MAVAFQCDRCGNLFVGTGRAITFPNCRGKELCEDCYEELKSFMSGASIGLGDDHVRCMFNILNSAWAFNKQGFDEVCDCSNCFHKEVCDCYHPHSDASMCNRFVSKYGITLGEEKREKLMKAVENCLNILDRNPIMDKEDVLT